MTTLNRDALWEWGTFSVGALVLWLGYPIGYLMMGFGVGWWAHRVNSPRA
jgi:hypothetical protein